MIRHLYLAAPMMLAFALPPVLPSVPAAAQEQLDAIRAVEPTLIDRLRDRAQQAFDDQDLVGLSIGIVRNGQVDATLHFGFADRENEISADDATMYRWASISKPVTAVAAIQLVETGVLDLEADIRTYVPEFPDHGVEITARQLLCHQGGIVHYTNGDVVRREREYDRPHPFEDSILALDVFIDSPLVCEPGSKMSYTTHGYMLLGAVVERAAGQRFIEQVRERVIDALDLQTLQPDYEWLDIPNRAVGYARIGEGAVAVRSQDVSWKLPGGGFISTVGDLAEFAAAMLRSELISPQSRERMWTRQKTRTGEETRYGLGFNVSTIEVDGETLRLVGHSGSQQKTRTQMLFCPETGDGIVMMSNSQWAKLGGLTRELLRMCSDDSRAAAAR